MDLLGLKDLQFKILYDNAVVLPVEMQNSILNKDPTWKRRKRMGSSQSLFHRSQQFIGSKPQLEIVKKHSREESLTRETISMSKLTLYKNNSSDFSTRSKSTSFVTKNQFYTLTFAIAEKFSNSNANHARHLSGPRPFAKYPPLSPIVHTALAEKDVLPVHRYKSWAELSNLSQV